MKKAIAVLLMLASAASAQTPAATQRTCDGTWSSIFTLRQADDRPVYVERGVIAAIGDKTVALGSPAFFWMTKDSLATQATLADTAAVLWSFTRAGALIDAKGIAEGVPLPDSLHPYREPKLVGWAGDRPMVAWKSGDSLSKDRQLDNVTRILVSTFDGKKWSLPDTAIRGTRLELYPTPLGRPSTNDASAILVTRGADSSGSDYWRIARREGTRWVTIGWKPSGMVSQEAAVTTADGSVLRIMYMPGVSSGKSGMYLQSIRGEWRGSSATWSEPVVLEQFGGSSYSWFTTARLGGDSVLVVRHQAASGILPGGFHVFLTANGGKSWEPRPFPGAQQANEEKLIVDASGIAHLVFRGARDEKVLNSPGAIMHSMFIAGNWTAPVPVSATESLTGPEIGIAAGGRVLVMWADGKLDPRGVMPQSYGRYWGPSCK